jgi:transcriptional regulator with XRE-family HTH domain
MLSKRLAERRAEVGLSGRALGALAGLSTRIVALIERGETNPKRTTIERLSEVLGCHAEWLASGTGPRLRRKKAA